MTPPRIPRATPPSITNSADYYLASKKARGLNPNDVPAECRNELIDCIKKVCSEVDKTPTIGDDFTAKWGVLTASTHAEGINIAHLRYAVAKHFQNELCGGPPPPPTPEPVQVTERVPVMNGNVTVRLTPSDRPPVVDNGCKYGRAPSSPRETYGILTLIFGAFMMIYMRGTSGALNSLPLTTKPGKYIDPINRRYDDYGA